MKIVALRSCSNGGESEAAVPFAWLDNQYRDANPSTVMGLVKGCNEIHNFCDRVRSMKFPAAPESFRLRVDCDSPVNEISTGTVN